MSSLVAYGDTAEPTEEDYQIRSNKQQKPVYKSIISHFRLY